MEKSYAMCTYMNEYQDMRFFNGKNASHDFTQIIYIFFITLLCKLIFWNHDFRRYAIDGMPSFI